MFSRIVPRALACGFKQDGILQQANVRSPAKQLPFFATCFYKNEFFCNKSNVFFVLLKSVFALFGK